MKKTIALAMAFVIAASTSTATLAQGKSSSAPGQDKVCLVESKNGGFKDVDVASTKWLPRKAAEAQASKDPSRFQVFDYTSDPLVGTDYESAEELCNTHFN